MDIYLCFSDATQKMEEVIENDHFVLSMKHLKPRRRLRGSVETLFAVDFPGSQQKFVLMLDRRSKRGKDEYIIYLIVHNEVSCMYSVSLVRCKTC